jgi:hypothetical protein
MCLHPTMLAALASERREDYRRQARRREPMARSYRPRALERAGPHPRSWSWLPRASAVRFLRSEGGSS